MLQSQPFMYSDEPTPIEIAGELMALAGTFVEFMYVPLFERKTSPSAMEKRADEDWIGPLGEVKGFLDPEETVIRQTKDGNWTITLHTMNRRKAMQAPQGVYARYGYDKGMYLPRCYRMEGIRLDTMLANFGARGKRPVFVRADGYATV